MEIELNEDGELVLNGKSVDGKSMIRNLIEKSRQFERALFVSFLELIADRKSNSLRSKALRTVARRVEDGDHETAFLHQPEPEK